MCDARKQPLPAYFSQSAEMKPPESPAHSIRLGRGNIEPRIVISPGVGTESPEGFHGGGFTSNVVHSITSSRVLLIASWSSDGSEPPGGRSAGRA